MRSIEDLKSRLQFFDKNNHLTLVVDGSVHKVHGEDLCAGLIKDGFTVDRNVVLAEMGREKDFEAKNEITLVIAKPIFRDSMVKALTGSSQGTSFNREAIEEAPEEEATFHILLVEDNKVNQRVAAAMLKKMGHDVDLAENGEEAVKQVQMKKYDAVLMDCQMPVLDGWEATRQIRRLGGEFEMIPIVALTANALAGDKQQCLDAGMNDYLSKPVKKQDLHDKILEMCGKRTRV